MENNALQGYQNGNISYLEYVQMLDTQFNIQKAYLERTMNYNKTVNALRFLLTDFD